MLHGEGKNPKRPTSGPNGDITTTVSGVPNASQRGTKSKTAHKWAQWLHNSCGLRVPMLPHPASPGPERGWSCCVNLCSLGWSSTKGTKLEVVASPMLSPGPKRGRNSNVTLAFSGVPNKGDKMRCGCLTLAFSWAQKRADFLRNLAFSRAQKRADFLRNPTFSAAQKRAKMLCYPCIVGGPKQRKENQKWSPHPCPVMSPKEGANVTLPMHSWGPQ